MNSHASFARATSATGFARGRSKRLSDRAPVKLDAAIVTMSAYQFPELVDISQTGARLKGSPLPKAGSSGLFRAGVLEVLCRVVWADGEQCGIRFDEPVQPKMLKQVQLAGAVAVETAEPLAGVI